MAEYSNTKLPFKLEHGDVVVFKTPTRNFRGIVQNDFVNFDGRNYEILEHIGLHSDAARSRFATACYGSKDTDGHWPQCGNAGTGKMEALTRMVLAIYSILAGGKVSDYMEEPKKKTSPYSEKQQKDIKEALELGDWGCQKFSVWKLISALTDLDLVIDEDDDGDTDYDF
jgi:hypothetical protein